MSLDELLIFSCNHHSLSCFLSYTWLLQPPVRPTEPLTIFSHSTSTLVHDLILPMWPESCTQHPLLCTFSASNLSFNPHRAFEQRDRNLHPPVSVPSSTLFLPSTLAHIRASVSLHLKAFTAFSSQLQHFQTPYTKLVSSSRTASQILSEQL